MAQVGLFHNGMGEGNDRLERWLNQCLQTAVFNQKQVQWLLQWVLNAGGHCKAIILLEILLELGETKLNSHNNEIYSRKGSVPNTIDTFEACVGLKIL